MNPFSFFPIPIYLDCTLLCFEHSKRRGLIRGFGISKEIDGNMERSELITKNG